MKRKEVSPPYSFAAVVRKGEARISGQLFNQTTGIELLIKKRPSVSLYLSELPN